MPLTDVRTIVRLTKIVVRALRDPSTNQCSAVVMMRDPTESRTPDVASHPLTPPMQMAFSSGLDGRVLAVTMLMLSSQRVPANVSRNPHLRPCGRSRITPKATVVHARFQTVPTIEWVCDADDECVSPLRTVSPTGLEAIMSTPRPVRIPVV